MAFYINISSALTDPPRMGRVAYRGRSSGRFTYVNLWVKYSLCLANFIFLAVGTFLLIFGIIALIESGGLPAHAAFSPLQWMFNLTVLCIVVGITTVFVSLAGFIGSLREIQVLLKCYFVFLAILFLAEVVACVLFFAFQDVAIKQMEDLIRKTFVTQYREPGFEDSTTFVNFIQRKLQCCGPKEYQDWNANRYFSCNGTEQSPEACGVPYSCCRRMNDVNVNVINTSCGFKVQTLSAVAASLRVWSVGCVQALVSAVEDNIIPVSCGVSGGALLQLVAILLAKTLNTQIGDQLRLLEQEHALT
ncbi:Tetraspanin [Fasciola gigantica]|uniref:Tetraspanin n=1 Tax=Fasciola gigantica TaxID=46835 RepID=A0A504Y990_FASGI|nr:Tetraspanin [Fasciola gigantica]